MAIIVVFASRVDARRFSDMSLVKRSVSPWPIESTQCMLAIFSTITDDKFPIPEQSS
jgi:hypothetical protein